MCFNPTSNGEAGSSLYPWAFARSTGGDFILRIEDTDVERSTQSSKRIAPAIATAGAEAGTIFAGTATMGNTITAASVGITAANILLAAVTTSGAQSYNGAVTVSAASTLSTTNSNVTFGNALTLGENLTLNTGAGAGDISVTGAIDGAKALSLSAGGTGLGMLGRMVTGAEQVGYSKSLSDAASFNAAQLRQAGGQAQASAQRDAWARARSGISLTR